MKFIVIKTITTITTEVHKVNVPESSSYPTSDDRAITEASRADHKPEAAETRSGVKFQVMEAD